MNIYRCWYQGIKGYSCRVRDKRWMFVPDIEQPDNRSYRNLELADLEFSNKHEKKFELDCEESTTKKRVLNLVRYIAGRHRSPATVYGQLLLPN